jgi:hypothetical protein
MRIDTVAPNKVNGVNLRGAENIPEENTHAYKMTDDVHPRWSNFALFKFQSSTEFDLNG